MVYSKNSYLLFLFFFIIYILPAESYAQESISNIKLFPSTIILTQTGEKLYLTREKEIIVLPKIEKEIIAKSWINFGPSIQNALIEIDFQHKEEMLSLSNKLGIKIKDSKHLNLYREAATWLGTKYRWAGSTRKGIDCSGLTNILFKTVYDKDIDRTSFIIANKVNEELEKENLEPGDLVFFSTMRKKRINHVGVYLGDGHFIHASRRGVVVSSLDDGYYARTLRKAGRI